MLTPILKFSTPAKVILAHQDLKQSIIFLLYLKFNKKNSKIKIITLFQFYKVLLEPPCMRSQLKMVGFSFV